MNKKLLFTIGIIVLVVLGYFALQDDTSQINNDQQQPHGGALQPQGMEQMSESRLELFKESAIIPFNKLYSLDEEWNLIINQFEPDAKIMEPGSISSDSDQEQNPAIKVDFYKNGDLVHYQICYKEMPGFHSVKPDQKYLLDLTDYTGFNVLENNSYSIESANIKIWRIK
jgi:hypothetical protein